MWATLPVDWIPRPVDGFWFNMQITGLLPGLLCMSCKGQGKTD